ncbi:MAG: TadE family protein, partial [Planctomycetota bacterium]
MAVRPRQSRPAERRGTTIVETAFVLPVFLIVLWGVIEFCHAQMLQNVLRSACREGARLGSTTGNDTGTVEDHVRDIIGRAVSPGSVQIFVKDASGFDNGQPVPEDESQLESLPSIELTDAEPRQLFLVRARINYNDVALMPVKFMDGVRIEG